MAWTEKGEITVYHHGSVKMMKNNGRVVEQDVNVTLLQQGKKGNSTESALCMNHHTVNE